MGQKWTTMEMVREMFVTLTPLLINHIWASIIEICVEKWRTQSLKKIEIQMSRHEKRYRSEEIAPGSRCMMGLGSNKSIGNCKYWIGQLTYTSDRNPILNMLYSWFHTNSSGCKRLSFSYLPVYELASSCNAHADFKSGWQAAIISLWGSAHSLWELVDLYTCVQELVYNSLSEPQLTGGLRAAQRLFRHRGCLVSCQIRAWSLLSAPYMETFPGNQLLPVSSQVATVR